MSADADATATTRGEEPTGTLRPNRRIRFATPLAGLSLALLVASAVLFTLPVSNPGVQSCGAPAWFLLQAKSDASLFDKQGKPINGWDKDQLAEADAHRCSELVADRAVPAGMLLAAFWLLALVAVLLVFSGRWSLRRRFSNAEQPDED